MPAPKTEAPPIDADAVDITDTPDDLGEADAAPVPVHGMGSEMVTVPRPGGSTDLIIAATAAEKVQIATEIATALDHVIRAQGMRTKVGSMKKVQPDGKEVWVDKYHVNVEAWQTLATFLGLAVVPVYCRPVNDPATGRPLRTHYTATVKRYHPKKDGGGLKEETTYGVDGFSYESRVEVYKDGALISAAIGLCTREESSWGKSDDFALSGMAQTRATSRAIAQAARWIVALAGYSGTPAEEHGAHEPPPSGPPEAGPAHGPAVSDDQGAQLRRATAWILDCDPLDEKVAAVLGLIEKTCDGYVPYAAGRAVGVLCAAVKTDREVKQRGATPDEPPATPPAERPPAGSVPMPDLSISQTAADAAAALRAAGCICAEPLNSRTFDAGCPLADHAVPF